MLPNTPTIIRVLPSGFLRAMEISCNSDYSCNAHAAAVKGTGPKAGSRPSSMAYP